MKSYAQGGGSGRIPPLQIASEKSHFDYARMHNHLVSAFCDENKSEEEQEKVLKEFFEEVMHAIGAEKYL